MKKILAIFLITIAMLTAATPVFAAGADAPATEVTSGQPEETGEAVSVVYAAEPAGELTGGDMTQASSSYDADGQTGVGTKPTDAPFNVRYENVGDVPYITRSYELAIGADISALCQPFELEGFTFTKADVFEQRHPDTVETRVETKTETIEVQENKREAVICAAMPSIQYLENGFAGELKLDTNSITIEEKGRESYGYRVTDVREYNALDRNDASYVPKTVTKNGVELQLESVEWVVMGTTPVDDTLVPTLFKAIATYSGGATGSKAIGYIATVQYSGIVTKSIPGGVTYNIVFRGEKPLPIEPEPSAKQISVWPVFFCLCGVAALIYIVILAARESTRKKKKPRKTKDGRVYTRGDWAADDADEDEDFDESGDAAHGIDGEYDGYGPDEDDIVDLINEHAGDFFDDNPNNDNGDAILPGDLFDENGVVTDEIDALFDESEEY